MGCVESVAGWGRVSLGLVGAGWSKPTSWEAGSVQGVTGWVVSGPGRVGLNRRNKLRRVG